MAGGASSAEPGCSYRSIIFNHVPNSEPMRKTISLPFALHATEPFISMKATTLFRPSIECIANGISQPLVRLHEDRER